MSGPAWMYEPSLSPWVAGLSPVPPQATRVSAATSAAAASRGSRSSRFVMRARKSIGLPGGDRRSSATSAILLEDRLQAAERAGQLALPPAASGDQLHQAVTQSGRLGLV